MMKFNHLDEAKIVTHSITNRNFCTSTEDNNHKTNYEDRNYESTQELLEIIENLKENIPDKPGYLYNKKFNYYKMRLAERGIKVSLPKRLKPKTKMKKTSVKVRASKTKTKKVVFTGLTTAIPAPKNQVGKKRGRRPVYPFQMLTKVGQSVLIFPNYQSGNPAHRSLLNTVATAARAYSKRHGINLFVGFNAGNMRVWRLRSNQVWTRKKNYTI